MADLLERLRHALASRYRVERELGRGGMATVFLAEDLRHRRHVAIKVLDREVAASIGSERFLREIETAARLTHPHILPLFDSGDADGLLYYVMPYVEGESLRARLSRERQLQVEDSLEIAGEVAEALSYAHRQGLVHRDIKPENILLEEGHAVVADFGIARAVMAAGGEKLTATGIAIGTPAYMSPEQAAGSRDIDGRSDLYSLGCALYEMLSGRPPFVGPAESLAYQHQSATVPLVASIRPGVPPEVEQALGRALAKSPADRFPTAIAFAEALSATHAPAPPSGWRRVALGAIIALVIAAAAWAGWKYWLDRPREHGVQERNWVIVADFSGPQSDPSLASAARDLVSAGLERSNVVTPVPRGQLADALRRSARLDTTAVGPELARELAFRNGVRVVIEGSIERIGARYSVVLRAVSSEDGHTLVALSDTAPGEDGLIPVLDRLGRKLGEGLGERRGVVKALRPMREEITHSFKAYRKYAAAYELQQVRGDDRGSIPLIREALELDPDFAAAWALKGFAHGHLGESDSAAAAFDSALSKPQRLTENSRMFLEGLRLARVGDRAAAVAMYRELVRREFDIVNTLGNLAGLLIGGGQYEEALDVANRAAEAGPFAAPQWLLNGQFHMLLYFNQLDKAEAVVPKLDGWYRQAAQLGLPVASGEWAAADSLARKFSADPTCSAEVRSLASLVLACEAAARGRVAQARAELHRTVALANPSRRKAVSAEVVRLMCFLGMTSGGAPQDQPNPPEVDPLTGAMWAVSAGSIDRARELVRRAQNGGGGQTPADSVLGTLVEAWVARATNRPDDVVSILQATIVDEPNFGTLRLSVGPTPRRWMVADSYEQMGQPDSAARYFGLILAATPATWEGQLPRRMASGFARLRLVHLYARMGRIAEAERHLVTVERTWDRGDPAVRRMLADAQAAVRAVRGAGRRERSGT